MEMTAVMLVAIRDGREGKARSGWKSEKNLRVSLALAGGVFWSSRGP